MSDFAEILENDIIGAGSPSRRKYLADHVAALDVRRTTRDLVKTPAASSTGDLLPYGDHTHADDVDYRVEIDFAGDHETATFRWSDTGGASWNGSGITVDALARIELQNGLTVVFAFGSYDVGDRWDFVAVGTDNQLYDLKVDTTNSLVKIGRRLEIANDSAFRLELAGGTHPLLVFDESFPNIFDAIFYDRVADKLLFFIDGAVGYNVITGQFATFQLGSVELIISSSEEPAESGSVALRGVDRSAGVHAYTPRFVDEDSHDSGATLRARNLIPQAIGAVSNALVALAIPANNTTGQVGLVNVLCPIMLESISLNASAASAGAGSFRIALYTEAGALIGATNLTKSSIALGVNTFTLAAPIYLPAGNYYVLIGNATTFATTQPTISTWTQNTTFHTTTDVLSGTVVMTAGAAPDPLGTITAQITARTPYIKLNGAAL